MNYTHTHTHTRTHTHTHTHKQKKTIINTFRPNTTKHYKLAHSDLKTTTPWHSLHTRYHLPLSSCFLITFSHYLLAFFYAYITHCAIGHHHHTQLTLPFKPTFFKRYQSTHHPFFRYHGSAGGNGNYHCWLPESGTASRVITVRQDRPIPIYCYLVVSYNEDMHTCE